MFRQVLSQIRRLRYSDIFWFPVKTSQAPGYLDVVERPMDLGTIQKKLENNFYESRAKFMLDIEKVHKVSKYREQSLAQ